MEIENDNETKTIISKKKLYSFMALLVLIVADMKCSCLSVLLVYATRCTADCVALAILIYQLVNDIRAHRGNACVRILQRYTAPRQSSTSGTECHIVLVGSRVQLQETGITWYYVNKRSLSLSQLALDLVASPASQAYVERLFSLCDLTARKRNSTNY